MDIDKAWESFIPKTLDPKLQVDLAGHSKLLKNLVAMGCYFLKWEVERFARSEEESCEILAISSYLRRILGLLNSCANEFEKGNVSSCGTMTRPIMELVAELDFLLADKNNIEHRVRCFMMMTYGNELQTLIEYRNQPGYLKQQAEVEGRISELNRKLQLPYFKPIESDYQSVIRAGFEKWYTLATWNWTRVDDKKKVVKGHITSIKWLLTNLKKQGRDVDHMAFSILSNYTHPSLLVQEAIGSDDQGRLYLQPIGFEDGYSEFVRNLIKTIKPVFTILNYRMTPTQRYKYQIGAGEFNYRFKALFLELFKIQWEEEAQQKKK